MSNTPEPLRYLGIHAEREHDLWGAVPSGSHVCTSVSSRHVSSLTLGHETLLFRIRSLSASRESKVAHLEIAVRIQQEI